MARTLELKIFPPVVMLGTGALMWLLSRVAAARWTGLPGQRIVAGLAIAAGIGCLLLGVVAFRRSRTTFNPTTPHAATALVASGIFRFTRNPMYLGFLLVLLGWALFLSNGLALLGLPAFILYMNRFQIAPEERALAALFGADFAAYKARVRKWL
jgi:protein-S-isoprenylcysteine O-methyltransferase Ste14